MATLENYFHIFNLDYKFNGDLY